MNTGLALGSGAARGFAHIAVIEKLIKEKVIIEEISGTSIGAIVAAYYALNLDIDSLEKKIAKLSKRQWLELIDLNNIKKSFIKGKKVKKFLHEHFFGDSTFRQTKIPLIVCATDLDKRKAHYFRSGKILDAVMASISIPGIFPPYTDKHFIDGGIFNPVPTDVLNCKKIIGVNINHVRPKKKEYSTRLVLTETFYIMLENLTKEPADNVFLISPSFKSGSAINFVNWKQNYLTGKREINRIWPKLKQWLNQ